jgi:hypothetical protein
LGRIRLGGGVITSRPPSMLTVLTKRPAETEDGDRLSPAAEALGTDEIDSCDGPHPEVATATSTKAPTAIEDVRGPKGTTRPWRTAIVWLLGLPAGHRSRKGTGFCGTPERQTGTDSVPPMAKGPKSLKRVAAAAGVVGTVVSIWWFALRPRRKRRSADRS